jgi:hypothetical protein
MLHRKDLKCDVKKQKISIFFMLPITPTASKFSISIIITKLICTCSNFRTAQPESIESGKELSVFVDVGTRLEDGVDGVEPLDEDQTVSVELVRVRTLDVFQQLRSFWCAEVKAQVELNVERGVAG